MTTINDRIFALLEAGASLNSIQADTGASALLIAQVAQTYQPAGYSVSSLTQRAYDLLSVGHLADDVASLLGLGLNQVTAIGESLTMTSTGGYGPPSSNAALAVGSAVTGATSSALLATNGSGALVSGPLTASVVTAVSPTVKQGLAWNGSAWVSVADRSRDRSFITDAFSPEMGSPPSQTTSAANAATSISSGTDHPTIVSSNPSADMTFYGRHYAQGGQDVTACVIGPGSSSGFTAPNVTQSSFPSFGGQPGFTRIEFWTDAAQLEVVLRGTSFVYVIRVNGQKIAAAAASDVPGGGAAYRIWLQSMPTGVNRVTVEGDGVAVRTIRVPITNGVWPSNPSGPKMVVVGDSFALATVLSNAEYAASGGFAQNIGYLLGLPNTVEQGISGTGVVNTVSATKPTYQERIGDLTAEAPDIVWVWGSVNDIGQSGVQAATLAYLQAVRTALPNAFVLMTSPTDQVGSAGNITNLTTLEGSYSAACTSAGVPFINLRTGAPMTGTGYVGHTVGDGNRDVYTGSDDIHPAGAGMKYVAGRAAPLIQALLAATRFG